MCGFGASSKILRGLHQIRFLSLLLILLTSLTCNTRVAGSDPTIQRITKAGDFNNEDLLIGHSGDPWGSRNVSKSLRHSRIRGQSSNGKNRNSLTGESSGHRKRRSVVHLYNMVICATGCDPMSYKGYGCYCGFLGSGTAVDGIDQCCRMHDRCYDATECPTFLEYFIPYYWKCYRGFKPICAVQHGKWGGSGSCAQRLCECDRALSECLRRFPCPTTKAVCTTSPWRLIQNVFMIF